MSREQMLYQIWFSHRLYSMSGVVLRRVDKTLSFLLLLLGSSVMGDIGWPQVTGFLIAALTALKMAFQFERSGEVATIQSRAWQNLYGATCVFRSIRSRIGIEVRSAIRIYSINRELNFSCYFLTLFFVAFHCRFIFPH